MLSHPGTVMLWRKVLLSDVTEFSAPTGSPPGPSGQRIPDRAGYQVQQPQ
jgi:hypothetical protein